jgi:hypothetical protein
MALTQKATLEGDTTPWNKAVAKAAEQTKKAFGAVSEELKGSMLKSLTLAAVAGTYLAMTRQAHEMANSVSDLADSLNISVEDTQRLGVAAGQTGTRIEKLHNAIAAVNALREGAFQYDPEAMRKFQIMGIDPRKTTMEIVHAMSQATGQAAIVVDNVFGRSAKKIREAIQTMRTMGPIDAVQQDQIDSVKQFDNSIAELKRTLVIQFAPILVTLNDVLQNFLTGLRNLTDFATTWFVTGKKPGRQAGREFDKSMINVLSLGTASAFYDGMKIAKRPPLANVLENPPAASPRYAPIGGGDAAMRTDALSRIGLFVGGAPNVGDKIITIGNYQLTQLRLIRAELEKLNQ